MDLCSKYGLAHLDLDTLAWLPTSPPRRKPLLDSRNNIALFIASNECWVIEGCYSDLLETAIPDSTEIVFMNLPIHACISNAQNRPWEPHKYATKAAQDANLGMLIDWIAQYPERKDTFSSAAHHRLYAEYAGKKSVFTSNPGGRIDKDLLG